MAEKKQAQEKAVLDAIAAWRAPYRAVGERLHRVIMGAVPELSPRLWYGMPGYARSGPVLCFFRADEAYMTFGLTEKVRMTVDKGAQDQLMPSAWFLNDLDEATEKRIAAIVRDAVG